MKALVVYDTKYGNTEKIAQAIGAALGGQARWVAVSAASAGDVQGFDLVIVGSPTHGGAPKKGIADWLKASPALAGVRVAAFDTRTQKTTLGYAAPRIAQSLEKLGAKPVATEGFYVTGMKGPLLEGELERAVSWARGLAR